MEVYNTWRNDVFKVELGCSGDSIDCIHLYDENGFRIDNMRSGRNCILRNVEGSRPYLDAFKENPILLLLLKNVTNAYIRYYKRLVAHSGNRGLDHKVWRRETDALLQEFPLATFDEVELPQLIWTIFLSYGAYKAQGSIRREFALQGDEAYLDVVKNLLEVRIKEAEFLSGDSYKDNPLYHSWLFSLRLKESDSCKYNSRFNLERSELDRKLLNTWGPRLTELAVDPLQETIVTFLGGPGVGKSRVMEILAAISGEGASVLYGDDIFREMGALREEAGNRLDRCLVSKTPTLWPSEKEQRHFQTYMASRNFPERLLIDRCMERLESMRINERGAFIRYVDTMGLASVSSLISRMLLNELLTWPSNKVLCDSLRNNPSVHIPSDKFELIEYKIHRIFKSYLDMAIELTGRPIIFLDLPVNIIPGRVGNANKAGRNRHKKDALSLRFLGYFLRESLPNSVVRIQCVQDNGYQLSPVQVAVESILALGRLYDRNILNTSFYSPSSIIQRMQELHRKVELTRKMLPELNAAHPM